MLGMVFTELVEMVEARFSPEIADHMIEAAAGDGGGAYTAVGKYPPEQLLAMVMRLSELTGVAVPDLVRAFGRHLLTRFSQVHPAHFERHTDLFDFLAAIDGDIHKEVHRLYPAAALPRFEVLSRDATSMALRYTSPRQMQMLALGLIEQLAEHCGQPVDVTLEPAEGGATFHIRRL